MAGKATLSRAVGTYRETAAPDEEFYNRLARASWPSHALPLGEKALIPLLGVELDGFSICDPMRGRAIFQADVGTWRYVENKRYRDPFTEFYALEPRHFLAVVSEGENRDPAPIVRRARCAHLAALLLKDGIVADPAKTIVTWLDGKLVVRLSGLFFRLYSWGFGEHVPARYMLQTEIAAGQTGPATRRPEELDLHSRELTPLTLRRFPGNPVRIAADELATFLDLWDVAERNHEGELLCEAESFLIRSFLSLHDVWFDAAYRESLVFTCFEAAVGPLSRRHRGAVLGHLAWLQARRGRAADTDAAAMLDELIAARRAVAHGDHLSETLDEPCYRWAKDQVRGVIRLCLDGKAAASAERQDPGLRERNYIRELRARRV
jgi:hypothetical protein